MDAGAEPRECRRLLEDIDLKAGLLQQDGGAGASEASANNCDTRIGRHRDLRRLRKEKKLDYYSVHAIYLRAPLMASNFDSGIRFFDVLAS
jgi:hypothetical protein